MCMAMLLSSFAPAALSQAQADEPVKYPLFVCGTQVTADNAGDILGDGTASYDAATSTLTLENFAVTGQADRGPFTSMSAIMGMGFDLTINLKGDNAIAGGSKGTACVQIPGGTVTFTGDGNLYAGGAIIPENAGSSAVDFTLFGNRGITFAESFTGTAVLQGPNVGTNQISADSIGMYSSGPIVVAGGTVIATGGTCTEGSSYGVKVSDDQGSVQVTGGTLIAQGGIAPSADGRNAQGISANDGTVSVTGGALVARGGIVLDEDGALPEEGFASVGRSAVSTDVSLGEGVSILEEVGYADGFTNNRALLDDGGIVTGIVIASNSFTEVDELPTALAGDVYHISTDGTNFATDVATFDTAGHTALFVNLFETSDSSTYQYLPGSMLASNNVSLSGNGKILSIGGIVFNPQKYSSGTFYSGNSFGLLGSSVYPYSVNTLASMTIDGPTVVGVGGIGGGMTDGIFAKSIAVNSGNLVGIGGTSGPSNGGYYGGNSYGIVYYTSDPQLTARGTSNVLAVGGPAGHYSWGLQSGYANSYDAASVMGVGGASNLSEGMNNTAYAYGGTILGIGGCATMNSAGCNSGVVSYPGGKVVALGGVFTNESGCSYGSWTSPYTSHAGDLLVAGRTGAYSYYDSYSNYNFYACSDGAKGFGWTDYDGTQGKTAVSYDTKQSEIANYKRIVVNGLAETTTLCISSTIGGTYTSALFYDGKIEGPMPSVTVEYGKEVTLTAEPILGYRFAGWYEGITDPNLFVYDNTGELISDEASYTFTPRGVVKLQAVFESTEKWTRVAGGNRYQTMAKIAQQGFPASCSYAVVATGSTFPDALAASSLAGYWDCPVILTDGKTLSSEAKAELERIGVIKVFIMGGELAVSKQVENAIKNIKGKPQVQRVAGGNRTETAVEVMKAVKGRSDTIIVATGFNFADSLSIGPWSYGTISPILLTNKGGTLDASTVSAIQECNRTSAGAGKKYQHYVIVGGTLAVSSTVESQLEAIGLTPLIPSQPRIAGQNRYDTTKLVAEFSTGFGMSADHPAVATGQNFPDALAAAPMQGRLNSVLLLVNGKNSPGVQLVTSEYYKDHLEHGYVIGGPLAVPQDLMDYIAKATASAMTGSSSLTAGSW